MKNITEQESSFKYKYPDMADAIDPFGRNVPDRSQLRLKMK